MNLHANAALSLKGRRELCRVVVERERTLAQAAEAAGVSVRCARKWAGRYRAEGEAGLRDRSSAPYRIPHRTSEQRVEAIAALRRLRFTGSEIAEVLGMALSTVSGILARIGMGKLGRVGLEPAVRYQRERPGELIHIDIKKLGRIERGAELGSPAWPTAEAARAERTLSAYRARSPAGSTSTSRSMTAPAWPTPRSYPTSEPAPSSDFSPGPSRSTPATESPFQQLLTDNGGAYRSTIHADRLPRPRCPPSAHPRLPSPDQRQGRTVHPHPHRRLGLRSDLPHQRRTHRCP